MSDTRTELRPAAPRCAPRSAHEAGLSGATVDVDLAPVVVHARRAGPSPRGCARAAPCRCGRSARPRPSARRGRPTCARNCPTRRVLAGARAGACGAGRAPRRGRRCRRRPAPTGPSAGPPIGPRLRRIRAQARIGSASARSGSGPEARPITRVALGAGHQVARGGPAEVGVRRPARAAGRRPAAAAPGRPGAGTSATPAWTSKLADQAEVDVHEALARRTPRTGACPPTRRPPAPWPSSSAAPSRRTGPAGCRPGTRPAGEGARSGRRRAGGGCAPQASPARCGRRRQRRQVAGASRSREHADPAHVPLVAR